MSLFQPAIRTLKEPALTRGFLYQGTKTYDGVSCDSFEKLKKTIKDFSPLISLANVEGRAMLPETWDKRTLLVFPGGRCGDWDQQISEGCINKIRDFVMRGGNVFAVCAGGYFCSQFVDYQTEGVKILKKRPLAFFPGTAKGPILESHTPNIQACRIRWEADQSEGYVLMNGGCCFIPNPGMHQNEYVVLARYLDQPPEQSIAVVKCKVGKGTVILSGPHFEFNGSDLSVEDLSKMLPKESEKFSTLRRILDEHDLFRRSCLQQIFHSFEPS